jgi:hypothetical protein
MEVEDTKYRHFVHDLDQELAECESDEDHPIFLSDIEKHLLKLPRAILINEADRQRIQSMQMVLYNVPTSLSVPTEQDGVRRAILETRQRFRDGNTSSSPLSSQLQEEDPDPDAMEL